MNPLSRSQPPTYPPASTPPNTLKTMLFSILFSLMLSFPFLCFSWFCFVFLLCPIYEILAVSSSYRSVLSLLTNLIFSKNIAYLCFWFLPPLPNTPDVVERRRHLPHPLTPLRNPFSLPSPPNPFLSWSFCVLSSKLAFFFCYCCFVSLSLSLPLSSLMQMLSMLSPFPFPSTPPFLSLPTPHQVAPLRVYLTTWSLCFSGFEFYLYLYHSLCT